MPDETKGPEINNTGPSPEAPKQPDSPKSPEQVRTDQVVEAAREAVAADKPQPVLEDVANGGNGGTSAEQADAGVRRVLDDGSPDYGGGVIGPSTTDREAVNSAGGSPPENPPTITASSEGEGDGNGEEKNNGSSDNAPPEIPPPPVVGTEGDGVNDEMARLHGNIEAVAQKKESGEPAMSTDETPKPIIVRQALIDNANRVGEGKGWDALAEGSAPEDVRAVLTQLNPELTNDVIENMTQEEVFSLISTAAKDGKIVVGEPELTAESTHEPAGGTEPAAPHATPPETPPDDDLDFSSHNPVAGTAPEPEPVAPETDTGSEAEPEPIPAPEPAPEPADAGPTPADPEPAPAQQETEEESWRRIYESMTPEGRHKRAEKIRNDISKMELRMDKVVSVHDMDEMHKRIVASQNHLDLIEETQADKNDPKFPDKKKNAAGNSEDEEVYQQARKKARQEADETARIISLPVGEHETELRKATGTLDALQRNLDEEMIRPLGQRDEARIKALNDELVDARTRKSVLEQSFQTKKAEDDKKKAEDESKSKSEEYDRQQLGTASSRDLQSRIDNLRTPLSTIQGQIRDIEKELANPATGQQRKEALLQERNKLLPGAVDLQKKYDELDSALTKAQEREADKLKPGEAGRFEPLKNISSAKWKDMTAEQRQDDMRELGKEKGILAAHEFDAIRTKIRNGEDLTVEENARYAKALGSRLMRDGRRGYDMKELAQLRVTNPDIHAVALDMYINSEAGKQQAKDLFPNNWQKILKFAKGKSWLIALLILLGGTAAVATGKSFGKFIDSEK